MSAGAAADGPTAPEPRVLVLTRHGCHLCEAAVAVVAGVCRTTGDSWAERDIDSDADLSRRYTDQVPVTFVDGRQHDFWRVDADRLRTALTTSRARPR